MPFASRSLAVWIAVACLMLFAPSAHAALDDGLIGYWQFDGNGEDSSGSGRDLTLVGGPSFDGGLFGQAMRLYGDGAVGLSDLNLVRKHFGTTAGAAAVPEPGGFLLALLAAFGAGLSRRRGNVAKKPSSRFRGETLEDRHMMALGVEMVSGISFQALRGEELNGQTYYFESEQTDLGPVHKLMSTDFTATGTQVVAEFLSDSLEVPTLRGDAGAVTDGLIYFAHEVLDSLLPQVWRTDGTEAGTFPVSNLVAGEFGLSFGQFDVFHNVLYFSDYGGRALWKSDGTVAGTTMVTDSVSSIGGGHLNDGFVFFGDDLRIWKSDGTDAGTFPISTVRPAGIGDRAFVTSNGIAYFRSHEAPGFFGDLWMTNGTPEGTKIVKDIRLGPGYADPEHMLDLDDELLFFADDGVHGRELWTTDGTEEGTLSISEFPPEAAFVHGLTRVGDFVYFTVYLEGGNQLWRSDGTAAGTERVASMHSLPGVDVNGVYVFRSDNAVWRSEGTPESTYRIADVAQCCGSFTSRRGTAYFGTDDGAGGNLVLWRVVRPDGDANLDGVVDLDDVNRVRNHFGQSGRNTPGDTNGDGIVDLIDLNAVRNHFGENAIRLGDDVRRALVDDVLRYAPEDISIRPTPSQDVLHGLMLSRLPMSDARFADSAIFDLWPDLSVYSVGQRKTLQRFTSARGR